jgi:DNA-binding ferritin-like protein (Dps family)
MNALNRKRIRNAKAALRSYIRARRYSDIAETDLTDLITDLYHLAQSEDVDVEVIASEALAHFKAELISDTSDEAELTLTTTTRSADGKGR